MASAPVTVLILAPALAPDAGPLVRVLDAAWTVLAERHRRAFLALGAAEVIVHREPPDDTPFGARLRRLVHGVRRGGVVIIGAGSMPLAGAPDRRAFLSAAAGDGPPALANNAYSADAIAVADAHRVLAAVPADLEGDNALPRWLREAAGVDVSDLRARRALAFDVDSPLDWLLLTDHLPAATRDAVPFPAHGTAVVDDRRARLRAVAADPAGELLVSGRLAAADLRWLERGTRARTRVIIEERGMRTASLAALRGHPNRRPPRSLLGTLLDRGGPGSIGRQVAMLADGALIDTRVLLAHRLGADERAWPGPEDRFASDLLLADRIVDPWLRELTAAAANAPVPVMLGAHTLVGPGARLALGARAAP